MAIGYLDSTYLDNIADAIRAKDGSSSDMTVAEMPQKIAAIPTGGGAEWVEGGVNFVDWDGTLLYSYTLAEAHNLTALPELPPAYKDYTASSWTENLAFVKALTVPWMVGVEYTTPRKSTRIFITVPADCLEVVWQSCSTFLTQYEIVDWGDGTNSGVITKTTTRTFTNHTYSAPGDYTITVWNTDSTGTDVQPWSINSTGTPTCPVIMSLKEYTLRFVSSQPTGITQLYFSLVTSVEFGTGFWILSYPFTTMYNLKKVLIPHSGQYTESYQYISSSAFEYSGLETLVCPEGVRNIIPVNYLTFVKKVVFPYSKIISTLLNSLYQGCMMLEHINWWPTIVNSNKQGTAMMNTFYGCSFIKERLNIPDGIVNAQSCFTGSTLIGNMNIDGNLPSSIVTLTNTFSNSSFAGELTVNSTGSLSWSNFVSNSPGITAVHMKATTPQTLGTNTFGATAYYARKPLIYVPYSADHSVLNDYKTAWSAYADFIYEEPAPTT